MNKNKFTLIEMLVVISIISILASLLAPMLQKSLDMSYQLQCANNLRQIGTATHLYINDYDFWPWPTYNSVTHKRWFSIMIDGKYLEFLRSDCSNVFALQCKMHVECTSSPTSDYPINSYVMVGTASTSGTPPVPWTGMYGISSDTNTGIGPNRLSKVLSPSKKIGIIERNISDDFGNGDIRDMRALYNSGAGAEFLGPIHDNSLNALYIDSHVENLDSDMVNCLGDVSIAGIGGQIWKELFAINLK